MAAAGIFLLMLSATLMSLGLSFFHSDVSMDRSTRVRRHARREYCCNFPWNSSFDAVYIECNVINETKEEGYAFPLRHEDPVPDFRFALLCPEGADKGAEAEGEAADECTCPGDRQDDLLHCLEEAKANQCESRCVYDKFGVVTSKGQPEMEKIEQLVFQSLNQDERFKKIIHRAVNTCSCKYRRMKKRYGDDAMEPCATLDILSYCIDYEIAKYCPEDARKDFNEDEECG